MMRKKDYEADLIRRVIVSILNHGGSDLLSSVILTGSFGRDEPTYTVAEDGSFQLKSDVEIALIIPKSKHKKALNELIKNVSQEFTEDLNLMPISETRILKVQNFNYSCWPSKYKTVFTFDLFNGSKTVWGRDYLQENTVFLADVDSFEAKRLVANRIGELCYGSTAASDETRCSFRKQWKRKVMLAMAGAWLILNQAYVSSYRRQFERIKEHKQKVNCDLGPCFFEEYEKTFHLFQENEQIYEVPDDLLRGFVRNIDEIFRSLHISQSKVNSGSRILKYCVKYVKTGMQYGLWNFEDRILQSLISEFYQEDPNVYYTAQVWHKVLY